MTLNRPNTRDHKQKMANRYSSNSNDHATHKYMQHRDTHAHKHKRIIHARRIPAIAEILSDKLRTQLCWNVLWTANHRTETLTHWHSFNSDDKYSNEFSINVFHVWRLLKYCISPRIFIYKRTYSFVVITCHSCWAPCSYIMPLYANNNKNLINLPCCCCCSVCFSFINDNFLYRAYRLMLCGLAFKMWNIKVLFLAVGRCFGKVKRFDARCMFY